MFEDIIKKNKERILQVRKEQMEATNDIIRRLLTKPAATPGQPTPAVTKNDHQKTPSTHQQNQTPNSPLLTGIQTTKGQNATAHDASMKDFSRDETSILITVDFRLRRRAQA